MSPRHAQAKTGNFRRRRWGACCRHLGLPAHHDPSQDRKSQLPVSLAPDELLDAAIGFVAGHLHGRMLGEKGAGGMEKVVPIIWKTTA